MFGESSFSIWQRRTVWALPRLSVSWRVWNEELRWEFLRLKSRTDPEPDLLRVTGNMLGVFVKIEESTGSSALRKPNISFFCEFFIRLSAFWCSAVLLIKPSKTFCCFCQCLWFRSSTVSDLRFCNTLMNIRKIEPFKRLILETGTQTSRRLTVQTDSRI